MYSSAFGFNIRSTGFLHFHRDDAATGVNKCGDHVRPHLEYFPID